MGGLGIRSANLRPTPPVRFCGPHLSAIRGWPLQTADIKTHLRASLPLPERKLREAHSSNMLMILKNIAHCDRLAAIPPKADIRHRDRHVRFVPKAEVTRN